MRWWSDNFQFLKCSLFSRPNSCYLLSLPGSMFQMSLSGQPKPLICVPVGERVQPAGIHFGSLQQKNKLINIYTYTWGLIICVLPEGEMKKLWWWWEFWFLLVYSCSLVNARRAARVQGLLRCFYKRWTLVFLRYVRVFWGLSVYL